MKLYLCRFWIWFKDFLYEASVILCSVALLVLLWDYLFFS